MDGKTQAAGTLTEADVEAGKGLIWSHGHWCTLEEVHRTIVYYGHKRDEALRNAAENIAQAERYSRQMSCLEGLLEEVLRK
jgi:hypothetical protein